LEGKKTYYSLVEIGYRSAYVRNALMLPFSVPVSSVYEGERGGREWDEGEEDEGEPRNRRM
jgi:hypothetical protein